MDPKKIAALSDAISGLAKRFDAMVEGERAEKDAVHGQRSLAEIHKGRKWRVTTRDADGKKSEFFVMASDLGDAKRSAEDTKPRGHTVLNVATKDAEPGTVFKKGDKIKENRQGAEVETVVSQTENMILTNKGNRYHVTKVVRA